MEAIITAIISAIGGALVSGLLVRRKNNAEASEVITRVAMSLITPLETKVKKLEKKLDRYGQRIIYLTDGMQVLIKQIKQDGKEPCFVPNEWDPNDD